MSRAISVIPTVWRQIVRAPIRTGLTITGIAVAMFLFFAFFVILLMLNLLIAIMGDSSHGR